jgi:hypothetical protein
LLRNQGRGWDHLDVLPSLVYRLHVLVLSEHGIPAGQPGAPSRPATWPWTSPAGLASSGFFMRDCEFIYRFWQQCD